MKNLCISAAFLAVFFVSGCAAVDRADQVTDNTKDVANEVLRLVLEKASQRYDKWQLELRQDAVRIQEFGKLIGRDG
ncbi:MAG: hypothetical protein V7727_18275 [Sneathiella sp.]